MKFTFFVFILSLLFNGCKPRSSNSSDTKDSNAIVSKFGRAMIAGNVLDLRLKPLAAGKISMKIDDKIFDANIKQGKFAFDFELPSNLSPEVSKRLLSSEPFFIADISVNGVVQDMEVLNIRPGTLMQNDIVMGSERVKDPSGKTLIHGIWDKSPDSKVDYSANMATELSVTRESLENHANQPRIDPVWIRGSNFFDKSGDFLIEIPMLPADRGIPIYTLKNSKYLEKEPYYQEPVIFDTIKDETNNKFISNIRLSNSDECQNFHPAYNHMLFKDEFKKQYDPSIPTICKGYINYIRFK